MIPATDGQKGGLGEEGAGLKGEYQLSWDVDSEVSFLACYVMGGGQERMWSSLGNHKSIQGATKGFLQAGSRLSHRGKWLGFL